MCVEIVIADAAFVSRSNSGFLTAVALERKLDIIELELVLGVAQVRNLIVLHCIVFLVICFKQPNRII